MSDGIIQNFLAVWISGGWLMIPLLLLAAFIYGFGMQLRGYLGRKSFHRLPEAKWQAWVDSPPEDERDEVAEIIRYARQKNGEADAIRKRFDEICLAEFPRIDRRIVFLTVLVTAAPLLGLLGTVFGMLSTFQGLAGVGADMTDRVASGISQALITTEMGLLIAIPGYFLVYSIRRRRNQYEAFLARMESFIMRRHQQEVARVP